MRFSYPIYIPRLLVFLLIGLATSSGQLPGKGPNRLRTLVIDAGHGGKDPGCLGLFSHEKDVAFDIAWEFGRLVRQYQPDVEVIFTRNNYHEFIGLKERARLANRVRADLFISIHCNASLKKEVKGTETYVLGLDASRANLSVAMRENSVILEEDDYQEKYQGFDPGSPMSYILLANYQQAHQENSLLLASLIQQQFQGNINRINRGVKQSSFLVLAQTTMPSVLVEVGFLSNPDEEIYLNSPEGKGFIAASLYRAFRDYRWETEGIQAVK